MMIQALRIELEFVMENSKLYKLFNEDDPDSAEYEFEKLFYSRYNDNDLISLHKFMYLSMRQYNHTEDQVKQYVDYLEFLDIDLPEYYEYILRKHIGTLRTLDKIYNFASVRNMIYDAFKNNHDHINHHTILYILKYVDDIPGLEIFEYSTTIVCYPSEKGEREIRLKEHRPKK